jgi:Zn-dependent protease with chaperone function
MRDFFDRQETARRKTAMLLWLYLLAVSAIVMSVYAVIRVSVWFYKASDYYNRARASEKWTFVFWDTKLFLITAFITLAIIIAGTLYRISTLRGGGRAVAEMMGARIVNRNTADPDEKRFLNVVEEMSLASGVPVPDVYLMEKESAINAFAAGFGIDDAVICVTEGTLKLLNRDELQGVVAHEFSHIHNGDMLINIRLMGLLHGILVIGLLGQKTLMTVRHSSGRVPIVGIFAGAALFVIGYVGTFFGRLIKSAISRQREYLADASAVQFTRNPQGIGGALKKIGGMHFGSLLMHPQASEASHMFISEGVRGGITGIMATHPPLVDRILRIDPRFDGRFPKVEPLNLIPKPDIKPKIPKPGVPIGQFNLTGAMAAAMLATAGEPMKEHADEAALLMVSMPEELMSATREPYSARALVYALLTDGGAEIREAQLASLKATEPEDVVKETIGLSTFMPELSAKSRLPLLDLSMPSLRRLSKEQYRSFRSNINKLIKADGRVSLFEYVLRHILIRRLDRYFFKPKKKIVQIYTLRGVLRECAVVLSLLARIGHRSHQQAEAAFSRAYGLLAGGKAKPGLRLLSAEECALEPMEAALSKLAVASPVIKRQFLASSIECLSFDKTISVEEGDLFRAIVESLDCPLPPWLSTPRS